MSRAWSRAPTTIWSNRFAFAELLARVRTLLRRGKAVEAERLHAADMELDLLRRRVTRGGRRIDLTAKEFALLELLLRRQGEVLPRSLIASQVWDMNFDSDTNVIEVAVRRLRAKIDDGFETQADPHRARHGLCARCRRLGMMRARASITLHLTLLFAAVSAAVLIGVGVLVSKRVEAHFEQQDMTELTGKLELVRHRLARVRAPGELGDAAATLSDALVGHHDLAVLVIAPDGRELITAGHAGFPAALLARTGSAAPIEPLVWRHDDRSYRGIVAVAATGIPGQPPAKVALALDIEHHLTFMSAFHKSLALAIAGGIALTALLGWAAARAGSPDTDDGTRDAGHLGKPPRRTIAAFRGACRTRRSGEHVERHARAARGVVQRLRTSRPIWRARPAHADQQPADADRGGRVQGA